MVGNHEEDSLSISIEPAPAPAAVSEKKLPLLTDCEIKSDADHDKLTIYLTINGVYI